MGTNWAEVLGKLSRTPHWSARSRPPIYNDGLKPENIQDAIATFERSLITPNARFDRYLRGDAQALISQDEQRGYQLFKTVRLRRLPPGRQRRRQHVPDVRRDGRLLRQARQRRRRADLGRYNVTKNEADKHVFKVPSLRNVALTAPYFHDGSGGHAAPTRST